MITLLTWNIQNGLAVDGTRSLARVVRQIEAHGTPDIICLQEVSRGVTLDPGVAAPDQVAELSEMLPEHAPYFGPAYDILNPLHGKRAQYGNLILSRLPVLASANHPLPQPPRASKRQMPRQAIAVTIMCEDGPLRIMTSHLEFNSGGQRRAQIEAIKSIHAAGSALAANPPAAGTGGPYQTICHASRAIICGDFNCLPDSDDYHALTGVPLVPGDGLIDSWRALHSDKPHPPSCGIFDHKQWPQGAHCRDYFVLSDSLIGAIVRAETDCSTDASDHQPLLLTLQLNCPG